MFHLLDDPMFLFTILAMIAAGGLVLNDRSDREGD